VIADPQRVGYDGDPDFTAPSRQKEASIDTVKIIQLVRLQCDRARSSWIVPSGIVPFCVHSASGNELA